MKKKRAHLHTCPAGVKAMGQLHGDKMVEKRHKKPYADVDNMERGFVSCSTTDRPTFKGKSRQTRDSTKGGK